MTYQSPKAWMNSSFGRSYPPNRFFKHNFWFKLMYLWTVAFMFFSVTFASYHHVPGAPVLPSYWVLWFFRVNAHFFHKEKKQITWEDTLNPNIIRHLVGGFVILSWYKSQGIVTVLSDKKFIYWETADKLRYLSLK